jgi:ankyrin repeat protein
VSQGADVTDNNNYAVQVASMNGHLEVVKYLVSQGADVTADTYAVRWAVQVASANGHLEVVKYLVSQGAPTTAISEKALEYLSFCKRMEEKNLNRAQKKIYFWWIQICYDMEHPSGCGQMMAERNLALYQSMVNTN